MKYCKQCGSKINEGKQFCTNCGVKAETGEAGPAGQAAPGAPNPVQPSRSQASVTNGLLRSTKSKVIFGSLVLAAAVLLTAFYVTNHFLAPEKKAGGFIKAVQENDAAKVKKYINSGQIEIKADDAQAKAFIKYLKSQPRILREADDQFKTTIAKLDRQKDLTVSASGGSDRLIDIKYTGKKWLLFNNYAIEVQPVYISVPALGEAADITINGKKAGRVDKKEETFGPYLPGEYKIKAEINGVYGKVVKEAEAASSDAEDQNLPVEFDLSENYIDLDSNYADADVYVNGKSIGKKVSDLEGIGPVERNGTVKVMVKKKFKAGEKKSNEAVITKDTDSLSLNIDYYENLYDTDYYSESDEDTAADYAATFEEEASEIKDLIREHYDYITYDDFESAYDLFSSSRKSKVSLSGWEKGFADNLRDEVTTLRVESIDGDSASAYVEMTSYDGKDDGSTLVQEWGGNWSLVKENGVWALNKASLKKLDSRVE
ncbi:zinc ribbon domain-containing protein [Peribacillus sp. SCS-37]|uniref:zinc ribbon domain-containing protein n=1 Tax=Paraperibacillus esterisolvens TaxID=3115296 RepID=UPI003905F8E5